MVTENTPSYAKNGYRDDSAFKLKTDLEKLTATKKRLDGRCRKGSDYQTLKNS